MQKEQWNHKKWVHFIIWKIGPLRCSKTHPGPKNAPERPREGQNWRQCTSCGPINWFWAKKTKFESVRSKVWSFHSESARSKLVFKTLQPLLSWGVGWFHDPRVSSWDGMGYTLHCTATGLYWTALLKGYPCEVHFTLHCNEYTKLYYSLVNCVFL